MSRRIRFPLQAISDSPKQSRPQDVVSDWWAARYDRVVPASGAAFAAPLLGVLIERGLSSRMVALEGSLSKTPARTESAPVALRDRRRRPRRSI